MRNITITVNHEEYHPNIFSPPGHGILTKNPRFSPVKLWSLP